MDDEDASAPHDNVMEFVFEGGDSEIGSLSSLGGSSVPDDADYGCLNEWGPKFTHLSEMYWWDEEGEG